MSRRDPWWLALVRWPLWSWGRLVTTVTVALVLGWAVGVGQGWLTRSGATSPSGPATAAGSTATSGSTAQGSSAAGATTGASGPWSGASGSPAAGATATVVTATTTGAAAPTGGASAATAPAGAVAAARAFVTAWARPDLAAEPWWQALNPLCTSTFAAQLHQTDPARVPAHRLVGEPVLSSSGSGSGAGSGAGPAPQDPAPVGTQVVLLAPTDAGGVLVSVVLEGAGWLVDDVEPADAPPAASTAIPEASVAGSPSVGTG